MSGERKASFPNGTSHGQPPNGKNHFDSKFEKFQIFTFISYKVEAFKFCNFKFLIQQFCDLKACRKIPFGRPVLQVNPKTPQHSCLPLQFQVRHLCLQLIQAQLTRHTTTFKDIENVDLTLIINI